ncbi:sugar phosphate isomerase/epimerase [Cohnella ginsengisoli]|uniref:Sugar phosphate isomerase/epimerase n=1 Tax=Cohnella ginsengisoli TaxID=425004 RepID=A0A9X4KDM5_9BACL|nr:sugar phosphate isomerase/epimerase family protein [Cohnella ginsengisoli]MDG0790088.1 sugar phosphate isomerase/epimerase [Cohnella ginsengisoli]
MKLTNKIGVVVDCFRLPLRDGLLKASQAGVEGVQIYAVSGELEPSQISRPKRKELKAFIQSLNLEVSALCGDLGGHGFQDHTANEAKIEQSKRIIDLAVDLGCHVVTTHIGVIPDETNRIYETMHQACEKLGSGAAALGAYFAIETGPETAQHLKSFLDSLRTKGIAVNFDPANMVMVTGDDPTVGVRLLRDYIVHTHVKDGIRYQDVDPRVAYGLLGYEPQDQGKMVEAITSGKAFAEVAPGKGNVNFDSYFQALQEINYQGYLTIEREVGDNPEADIRSAVEFIKHYR